jgi:hypothetical protein
MNTGTRVATKALLLNLPLEVHRRLEVQGRQNHRKKAPEAEHLLCVALGIDMAALVAGEEAGHDGEGQNGNDAGGAGPATK